MFFSSASLTLSRKVCASSFTRQFRLTFAVDEDLHLIFSRFGKILSCEVIRDKRTGDSLQYAFIEFENQKDCEQAYFKMQGVLIDDHRIHVDFSQSVSIRRPSCLIRLMLNRWRRFLNCRKVGEPLPTKKDPKTEVALEARRIWRGNDSTELEIFRENRIGMGWFSTRMTYVVGSVMMSHHRLLVAGGHEAEVPTAAIDSATDRQTTGRKTTNATERGIVTIVTVGVVGENTADDSA